MVTAKVGISPIPLAKSVFQKAVETMLSGLKVSHWVTKVFGPEPKSGREAIVLLAIFKVTANDGLTSTLEVPSLFPR